MPKTVTIPGVGDVDFPDTMSNEEIAFAAKRLAPKAHGVGAPMMAQQPSEKNVVSSAITGGLDVAGGLAGLVSRGAEALGMPKGTNNAFIANASDFRRTAVFK